MRLPTAIYFARQSTLGFCNWLVVTCLFSMSFILNAIQKTLGSAVSFVVDYGKWIIGCNQNAVALENSLVPCASPLVSTRRGSMFQDEDGDLAHEFYEEVDPLEGRPWMRRVTENLTEQGIVKLRYPRLHVDFPVALYEG